jgi:hypothetical protein
MAANAKQVRLVDAPGDELTTLLAPVTPQTFVDEYWGKKPLHVKGFREKFQGFFDHRAFVEATTAPGRAPLELRASFDKKTPAAQRSATGEPMALTQAFRIAPELALPLFEAGATLCFTDIEQRVRRLAYFAAAIKRQLDYPGKVGFNAYLSGAGAGLNWHFDGRIASTLQIEGSKTWRFANRGIDWPRGNGLMLADGTARYAETFPRHDWERLAPLDKKAVKEVVLEPGDLLILPAGTWHDASGGTAGSLALNLSFTPVSLTPILGDLLDSLLVKDPGWRSPSPLLPRPGSSPGEADPRALEAIGKQVERAAEALRAMAADSAALVAIWSLYVQNASPPIDPPAPLATPIAPTDRFRVRADGNVYPRLEENGTKISVAVGARARTEASGDAMRFIVRALTARQFTASECLDWGGEAKLTWADVEQTLVRLVSDGVLERATK